jgi:BirA family transcriptional regulator, biotin operon repressor / biotin---[acetyl-CoA-carboxylase] ligase
MTPVAAGRARPSPAIGLLGRPRLHLRRTDSTNERARALAIAGGPHGTLVTAAEQTAGRGRQGRSWTAPPGGALLCSLVLRDPPKLLSLIAGVAVCDAVGEHPMAGHTQRAHGERAQLKWPNDVVVEPNLAKLAGILVEGRPQEGWAVLGIGLNVAVRIEQLPAEVRGRAASLELPSSAIEPIMDRLLEALERRLVEPGESVLEAWRTRDALRGRDVSWAQGHGRADGIDGAGRLIVRLGDGATTTLDAGEVHLEPACRSQARPPSPPL